MNYISRHPKLAQFAALLVVFFILCFAISPSESNFLWRLPASLAAFPEMLNTSVEFVLFEWIAIATNNPEMEH